MKISPKQLDLLNEPDDVVISKTKFMYGWQCPKLLWHHLFASQDIKPPDKVTQSKFRTGQNLGALARKLYPSGTKMPLRRSAQRAFQETLDVLQQRKPVFEAAALYKGAFALADILLPAKDDKWDLIEVKSSASTKSSHIVDATYQVFVFQNAGIQIDRAFLMHINTNYKHGDELEINKLFTKADIQDATKKMLPEIITCFARLTEISKQPTSPDIPVGEHCFSPYKCPMFDKCWQNPPNDHVLNLHRGRQMALDLIKEGVSSIHDIPDDVELTATQKIQKEALRLKQSHVDKNRIRQFLAQLEYPLFFLDLESFQSAVPIFTGTKPFEQISFQFSLHICQGQDEKPEHFSFLAKGDTDPRPLLLERLKPLLGDNGSIVAFNTDFEKQRLAEAATAAGLDGSWIRSIASRFVDLHDPFARFYFYSAKQRGSTSMKTILPILTAMGYDELALQDGRMASLEFLRTHAPQSEATTEEKSRVRSQLLKYCKRDTEGMIAIVKALHNLKT